MLVPASQTSPVVSRRKMLGLIGAGVATCALPTISGVSAEAEQSREAADISGEHIRTVWQKRERSIRSLQCDCAFEDTFLRGSEPDPFGPEHDIPPRIIRGKSL